VSDPARRDDDDPSEDPAATVARLRTLVERTRPVSTADQRTLPVLTALEDLLPGRGLRRGSVLQVDGQVGATSLALAVAAGPTRSGSWVACVGADETGWAAAAEVGVDMERLVVVRTPERSWATVTAALVDAFDVVLCALERNPSSTEVRRLQARARERGAVLVVLGGERGAIGPHRRAWPEAADVTFTVVSGTWSGIAQGSGRLRSRRLTLEVSGRRGAGRPRRVDLLLPGPTGELDVAPGRPWSDEAPASSDHAGPVTAGPVTAGPTTAGEPPPLRRVG
jgi:hypothetical protein